MNWKILAERVLNGASATRAEALAVLASPAEELLAVLDAAFTVRRRYFGLGVSLHIICNAKSGLCSEDCAYCSQAAKSTAPVPHYAMQSVDDIVQGAREAQALKVPLLGRIPLDPATRERGDSGTPVALLDPNSNKISAAFREVAASLMAAVPAG